MHLVIVDGSGTRIEAIALAVGTNRLRVAIRGNDDAMDLSLAFGQWTSENGEYVEIAAVMTDGQIDMPRVHNALCPKEKAMELGSRLRNSLVSAH